MELPAAGEHVFAVESIEKKRSRKVCLQDDEGHLTPIHMEMIGIAICFSLFRVEYMFVFPLANLWNDGAMHSAFCCVKWR